MIIGKNYQKFPEAKDLIAGGGVITVGAADTCHQQLLALIKNDPIRSQKGAVNKQYVLEHQGATAKTVILLQKAL